jgi:acetyl esterase/lipase
MFQQVSIMLDHIWFNIRLIPWFLCLLFEYHIYERWFNRATPTSYLERNVQYATDNVRRNKMDIYHYNKEDCSRIILFVHGGAWNSGDKMLYYHLAQELRSTMKCSVAVMNYTLYPKGFIEHQIRDLNNAICFLRKRFPSSKMVLIGHSAGAHLVSYWISKRYLTQEEHLHETSDLLAYIHTWIGMSGVYDILDHYLVECRRGVEKWSGMEGAMHGAAQFCQHSPRQFYLRDAPSINRSFVNTVLLHGECDETVPVDQSRRFYEAMDNYFKNQKMAKNKFRLQFKIIPKVNHTDVVLSLMKVSSRRHHRDVVLRYLEDAIM